MLYPCCRWEGTINSQGYGVIIIGRVQYRIHRLTYTEVYGTIPKLDIGHVCHDLDAFCAGGKTCLHRACYEITHLRPMTRKQNLEVLIRLTCPHGHPRVPNQRCPGCNRTYLRNLYESRRQAGLSTNGTPYTRGPYAARKTG